MEIKDDTEAARTQREPAEQHAQPEPGTTTAERPGRTFLGEAVHAVSSVAKQPVATLDRLVARGGDAVWGELKRHPYVGVAAAGGIGIAVGSVVGLGQIALGALAGYAAYRMLTKKDPPSQALRDAARPPASRVTLAESP